MQIKAIARILLMLAAIPLWSGAGDAAPRQLTIQHDTFGSVELLAPSDEPKSLVIYLSDGDLTPERLAEAERIVALGAAVVPLSTQAIIQQMDAKADPDDDCFYALGEFEDLSTTAQRALGTTTYRLPVILGNGTASGTLAYLSLAQAPANTAAGAISIGFASNLKSRLPLCAGAKGTATARGGFTYAPATDIPGSWILMASSQPSAEIAAFVNADSNNKLQIIAGDPTAQLEAAAQAALQMSSPPTASLADLPLVELPAQNRNGTFAIFLSGDGGWRDIDKSIAETLATNGLSVVGVDSLHYFWKQKDPARIAQDLERIVSHYKQKWQAQRVLLLGFSMGADVIPPAWSKLSKSTRDSVKLIVLLGLEPTASYEISIAGYVGIGGADEVDIRPDLKTLPVSKVMCFYGTEENADGDAACTLPDLKGATLLERQGGHHLDGDYEAIAKDILERARSLNLL